MDSEKEEEEVRLRTDGEIVEDIRKETTWVNGETVNEDEGDGEDCNDDDEQITLAEMMDAAVKLEGGAPTVGGCGPELSNLCRKFRIELRRVMMLKAQQMTLDDFFAANPQVCHTLAGCHIVLHCVTNIITHNADNALRFWGNRQYALLQFLLYTNHFFLSPFFFLMKLLSRRKVYSIYYSTVL